MCGGNETLKKSTVFESDGSSLCSLENIPELFPSNNLDCESVQPWILHSVHLVCILPDGASLMACILYNCQNEVVAVADVF